MILIFIPIMNFLPIWPYKNNNFTVLVLLEKPENRLEYFHNRKVIGVMDGCHIKIQSQGGNECEIFRNRTGYLSLNIQAITSADLLFQDILTCWHGSTHDTTIFRNSRIKHRLDNADFGNSVILEVARVQNIGRVPLRELKYVDIYREKPMKVAVKVLVPVREHPKFNFVGKLLGPKGNSMKRLQEDTMCKMAVLGRGSMKDRQKEEELRQSLDPKYAHLCDDLHVEISALGPPAEAHARIAFALAEVRKYLIPDNNDNIRQEQMREMEIITSADPSHKEVSVSVKRPSGILRAPESRPSVPMRTATRMPVTTPRVMPAKTKILSILDRARIAMEESYSGSYEEPYEPNEPTYDPYASTVSHSRSSYSTHYDSHDYDTEYYRESTSVYEDAASHRWKPYKTSSSGTRHSDSSRYRSSPYARPSK